MLYGVYRLAGYEWLRWDGPLTREEAEKLAAYRQEQYGDTFKADVLDTDWDEGYSTTPEPAEFFIAESKRRAVYDDEYIINYDHGPYCRGCGADLSREGHARGCEWLID